MDTTSISDFAEAIGYIQLVTGCKIQTDLIKFLDLRQPPVTDVKKRGTSLPIDF